MRSMIRTVIAAGLAMCCGGVPPAAAFQQVSDDWSYALTPYFWLAGVDYDLEVHDNEVSGDAGFDEIWDVVEIAVMTGLQARKGPWAAWVDVEYLSLEYDGHIGPRSRGYSVGLDQLILEVGGAYMVHDRIPQVELLAGARYVDMEVDIDLDALGDPAPVPSRSASSDEDWVDPFVGARVGWEFTDWWYTSLRGDVGGFDVGSELTWQAMLIQGFRLSESIDLRIGYRHLDIDYDDGMSLDMEFSGPITGLTFRF